MTAVIGNNIEYMTAKGWLKDAERKLLFELASRLPGNAVILNIGVEFGASLACLRAGNPTALIYGVDLDISKAVSDYAGCLLLQEDSHKLITEWQGSIDLIFVDGDHGQKGVFLDAGFADFLPVGNYILFQDCWDWEDTSIVHQICPGVNAGVDQWFDQPNIKMEFEELPSVETTRVFKRVKEHEQPGVTHSSGVDTDLSPERGFEADNKSNSNKPQVQRRSIHLNRG